VIVWFPANLPRHLSLDNADLSAGHGQAMVSFLYVTPQGSSMLQTPPEIATRLDAAMVTAEIDDHHQPHFRRWLRFYLDFRQKYGHEAADQASFSAFAEKLQSKDYGDTLHYLFPADYGDTLSFMPFTPLAYSSFMSRLPPIHRTRHLAPYDARREQAPTDRHGGRRRCA